MREIKFRAWHMANKVMFSPGVMGEDQLTIMPDGRGFVNVSGDSTRLSQFMPHMIPMQYTGLKDKNGKEIYEGDIVRFECANNEWSEGQEVKFRRGSFGTESGGIYSLGFTNHAENLELLEVIGNIYENPELLSLPLL